ncbi:23S rRNA (uracil(1939)-C(5))-methyltransferase RlmD [Anaerotignum lactatifermentans]|uniref:23S rRNA (Uracil(1939)-C(5))-methyltransferase RlmD n=1 Tax=Anaerotignum lactatifermentans TaxID=160404 RepID=A0ABS2G8E0_9FIRM|nr:23S rRNA (uracil(1939)-C(5))-methyltransferase RlmD [Anaerotignum lactatifermentans]MBM6829327.1 23S rRNA (uracil(1939)-C(5))-methyltransferase RlmD [Anaerotignum lactatifermentans]MBM6877432.1 23S rRNA (uracil(1939)-C(5))-methyltransferase RlmD [Anaerotignum lactatifermentans]MBM6950904.1 23S rRNA (uracil(1939)-C(5))-methyltransferase RlmD [Anaerotignum lactatifermentans]
MKKKEIISVTIEDVRFPNKAYGHVEGEKVIVKNAVPGQVVQAQVMKKRSGAIEARLLSVEKHSCLERGEGMCSHYAICGGCTYQTMERAAELEMKERQVKRLLEEADISVEQWEGITPSPLEEGYRNKCEFSFGDEEKDGPLALGMRKKMSHYEVVSLKDCNIVDADFVAIVQGALAFFQERKVAFYHRMRHDGSLRHLVVRKGKATGEILVHLVTTSEVPFSLEEFKEMILALPLQGKICGILHSVNDGVADVVRSDEMTVLYGRDFFMEKLFDLEFKVSAYSFFQTNTEGAEKLYSIVREFAGDVENKTVFDLYCGTGTIGQIMAKAGSKKVMGIELVEEAVAAANENAARNGLTNCTFLAGDVLKMVDELTEKPDVIIVDPPREGIHPKAIGKIIDFGAPEIVYVSCKPTSLARDLQAFQEAGYAVKRARLMDMFPRTVHVETVVLLGRELEKSREHVYLDYEPSKEIDLPGGATYEQIKAYVLEHTGLKVSHLYIAQVKQKHGIIERECYNKPKSEDAKQPQCPPEKEAAIEAALKHFKMI